MVDITADRHIAIVKAYYVLDEISKLIKAKAEGERYAVRYK